MINKKYYLDDKEFTESTQIKIPSKLWLYFLELDNTNKHISLNFEIHDNNYSNSFMTNTAMIKIHRVGLIPENLFYDKQKILPRLCKDIRNYFIISKKQEKLNRMSIHKSYRRYYERRDWPFVSQYECTWIGGSEKIEIPIIKKHNIFMLRCDEDYNESQAHPKKGFILIDPYLFWLKRHQQVINITNEDQRSYNTQKNR